MTIQRNDITVAVETNDGHMYVAQGNPAWEVLKGFSGSYDCDFDLYHSQVYHRCAALTPDGWRIMTPTEAKREGYEWARFPARAPHCTGKPAYLGKAHLNKAE